MNIIVYYPETKEAQEALTVKVARNHAEQIQRYLERLNCTTDQKLVILDAIIETIKSND